MTTAGDNGRSGNSIVAVYGTLRSDGRLHHRLGVASGRAEALGLAHIAGDLFEVAAHERDVSVGASYPCLRVGGAGRVVVELYRVIDPALWAELDALEGFVPDRPNESEYVRREVALIDPPLPQATRAWTYVYARAPDLSRHIPDGDWIAARR